MQYACSAQYYDKQSMLRTHTQSRRKKQMRCTAELMMNAWAVQAACTGKPKEEEQVSNCRRVLYQVTFGQQKSAVYVDCVTVPGFNSNIPCSCTCGTLGCNGRIFENKNLGICHSICTSHHGLRS